MKYFATVALLLCFFIVQSQNISFQGKFSYNQEISDVWGYVDEFGNQYALVGAFEGFSVLDVTDPTNIQEVFYEAGPKSTWRDIKVWNDHAYITNENTGGVLIVDLSPLPSSNAFPLDTLYGWPNFFTSAHNIWIDENGFAYIFGANQKEGGAIIFDLSQPKNPQEVGIVDDFYLHDGFVRNDTLWGSAIYEGLQVMYDVSDKSNPQLIGSFETPGNFAHNCWPSENSDYVFTTDEIPGGYIGAYSVMDFDDPYQVGKYRLGGSALPAPIPHNSMVKGNLLFTSYYSEGLHVLDISNPLAMVEVGKYDTSPNFVNGFHGAWGVYPYFNSDKILIADIEEGLFVLDATNLPTPGFIVGDVRDIVSKNPITGCTIDIIGMGSYQTTQFGNYAAGVKNTGSYSVRFSKPGYRDTTLTNVIINQGATQQLDAFLTPTNGVPSTSINNQFVEANPLIFPNPFNNELNFSDAMSFDEVEILDMKGSVVLQTQERQLLNLQSLPKAPYLLRLKKENHTILQELIFKR